MKIIKRVVLMDNYSPNFLERLALYFLKEEVRATAKGFMTFKVLFSTMYVYEVGFFEYPPDEAVRFTSEAENPWNN